MWQFDDTYSTKSSYQLIFKHTVARDLHRPLIFVLKQNRRGYCLASFYLFAKRLIHADFNDKKNSDSSLGVDSAQSGSIVYYFQSTFFNFSMFCPVGRLLPSFYVLSSLLTIRRFVIPTFLTIRRFFRRLFVSLDVFYRRHNSHIGDFFLVYAIVMQCDPGFHVQYSTFISLMISHNGFSALGSGSRFLPAYFCGAKLLRLKFLSSKCISCNVRVSQLEVSMAHSYAARNSSDF